MFVLYLRRFISLRNRINFSRRKFSTQGYQSSYQFLQSSKLPTYYFQKSLPRLPIPKLPLTILRFLAAVEPILNQREYDCASRISAEFLTGDGAELHQLLQKHDKLNLHTSYISKPWFDMYLSDRSPLPLNYNPLLVMKHDPQTKNQDQLLRATNLVISSLRFWRSLQAELLEPEIYHLNAMKSDTQNFRNIMRLVPQRVATYAAYAFKAIPLDMSQYNHLFGVSRVPGKGKDYLVRNENSKHILVIRGGNLYSINVLDENGNIEKPDVILRRLQTVLNLFHVNGGSTVPIGPLTSIDRNEWATLRQHLTDNIGGENKRLLETEIDAALFCLCLDSPDAPIYNEENFVPLIKNLLAGDGTNRWFDKSISLIVTADGTAAVNFEHSWGDGVAVLRYFKEIFEETIRNPFANASMALTSSESMEGVRPIILETDTIIKNAVKKAVMNNNDIMKQLNIDVLKSPQINKDMCKELGLSPDAIMQLSFQVAYKRAFNDYVGTYESCSTAAFRHGRTETVRPCTMVTKRVCESLQRKFEKQLDVNEIYSLFKQCSILHSELTKKAAMGQGFDRHLFALRHQAQLHGKRLPDIYESDAYTKINHNIISTSTLSSDALLAGSFGPVVRDGLGIAYSIQNDYCGAIVSSYENQRNGKDFVDSLQTAFCDISNILTKVSK